MATDTPLLQSGSHVDTRDFRIEAVSLISSSGTYKEVGAVMPEIQVRQDMYMGFMSGEALVIDGTDLSAQLQIHGGEYLFLHFTVPEQNISLKKAFRVYKVGKRVPMDNAEKYTIYFMSDELFLSYKDRISKAYPSSTLSDIAKDIMINELDIPASKAFIDPTDDAAAQDDLIVPNMRPLEALNWLASRAYTNEKNTWFFYETFEGFHFKSLNTIYKSKKPIKVPFTFENKKASPDLSMDKFAIDDMEARRDFDCISTLADGGYSMQMNALNVSSRQMTTTKYALNKDINKLYDNAPMSNGGKLYDATAYTLWYPDGFGIEKYVKRVMALAALNSNLIEIVVPGNMGLNVGSLVSIRVPYTVTSATGDMWDKQKSGKYLLFAVNHKFDMVRHKYTCLAYLSRDSLPESLPPASSTLPDKIKKLNS